LLVNCLTAEVLPKEHVPVWLEVRVHVLLDVLGDFDTLLLEFMLVKLLLSDLDD
jgi:hypothetical protein